MVRRRILLIALLLLALGANAAATTYYVKPDGNDNAAGTSDATAWRTISKVNSFSFQPGDDVYFKCGGTWDERLYIDWNGASSQNPSVIGAYYMHEGNEVIGVSGNKPVIDGEDRLPSSPYQGMIDTATSREHLVIENIRIINSEGYGVNINQGGNNIIVRNIETYNTYNAAVRFYKSSNGVVEGCWFTNSGRKQIEDGSTRPAIIAIVVESHDFVIRKNSVYNNYGEGIGVYKASYNCVIEDNFLANNRGFNIYMDAAQNVIVRRNLIYNTSDSGPSGIGSTDEGWVTTFPPGVEPCNQIYIYGNFVAFPSRGIVLNAGKSPAAKNSVVSNNTVIAPREEAYVMNVGPYSNVVVKNNIAWTNPPGSRFPGVLANVIPSSGLTFGNNYWSAVPDSDAQSSSDPGYPTYENGSPRLRKESNWQSLVVGGINYEDFALTDNSTLCIDRGANLGSDFDDIVNADNSNFDYSNPLYGTDISVLDQDDYGSAWEIGADIYTTANPPAPPATPTGFTCSQYDAQAILCSWNSQQDATSFEIYHAVKSGNCQSGDATITGITGTSKLIEGLVPDTEYCVFVRARNSDGASDYTSAQTPSTAACDDDLLGLVFNTLAGWSLQQGGTATITLGEGNIVTLSDSSDDYRALMSKSLGNISADWTLQVRATLSDLTSSYNYSGSAGTYKLVGFYVANGSHTVDMRFIDGKFYYRNTAGSWTANVDFSTDNDEHLWRFTYDDSETTLKIYVDGELAATITDCGYTTTWDGGFGIQACGTSTDAAELIVDNVILASGVCGAITEPSAPTLQSGDFILELR